MMAAMRTRATQVSSTAHQAVVSTFAAMAKRGLWMSTVAVVFLGCSGTTLPDAKIAAQAYANAAAGGDGNAVYAMLSDDAKTRLAQRDVGPLLASARDEFAQQRKDFQGSDVRVKTNAELAFADGERVSLVSENGEYRIVAGLDLPGGGPLPEQALGALRRALARRSYAALLRLLTPETRLAMERDLASLVIGLERPETLEVKRIGDKATVAVPGGHIVRLRRDDGVWRVEDFE